jgi:superfamily II DNA or RNA helicase
MTALRQTIAQRVLRVVVQSPTGSGKTACAAAIVDGALQKGNRVAFVVPYLSLIDQAQAMFYYEGITDVGIIQGQHQATDWSKPVQICSAQTLERRERFPEAHVVIIDECHLLRKHHITWLKHPDWQKVPFIGLSATPFTKGLGKYFETMLIAATTQELIDKKYLSPFRCFASGHPDLSNVKIVSGEYQKDQLSGAMQEGTLTADIVSTWRDKWGQDKTLCFGVDRAHAKNIQERFTEAGISCAYQDANTPPSERAEIKRKFHNGEYRVISNVDTLSVGVDFDVRCLILARPTRSESRYVQIVGRALRTAPGKDAALILDHSDTTQRLGFVTDIYHDRLDDGKPKQAIERKPRLPKACPQCTALRPAGVSKCPACGFEAVRVNGHFELDGELVEIAPGNSLKRKGAKREYTMAEKSTFLAELKAYGISKQYKPGWASRKYQEKFEAWPHWSIKDVAPAPYPSSATMMFIKSRQIAWAKSKRNEVHAQ